MIRVASRAKLKILNVVFVTALMVVATGCPFLNGAGQKMLITLSGVITSVDAHDIDGIEIVVPEGARVGDPFTLQILVDTTERVLLSDQFMSPFYEEYQYNGEYRSSSLDALTYFGEIPTEEDIDWAECGAWDYTYYEGTGSPAACFSYETGRQEVYVWNTELFRDWTVGTAVQGYMGMIHEYTYDPPTAKTIYPGEWGSFIWVEFDLTVTAIQTL